AGAITSTGPYITDGSGKVYVTVNSSVAGTAWVHASATVDVDGVDIDVATNGYGAWAVDNEKTWVDARISIEESDTNPVNTAHNFTVTVEMNDGDGWDPAVGIDVTPWLDGSSTAGAIISAPPYTTDGSGQVIVTVNSAVAGSATVHASATVNVGGIDIDVATNGYGAYYVSNVKTWEGGGGEGCTPGYWKNNAAKKGAVSWVPTGYSPDDKFGDVAIFNVTITVRAGGRRTITDPTLLQALQATGGGVNALARHAVAALLNSAHPLINYDMGPQGVIDLVHDALVSPDPDAIGDAHTILAGYNEAGCPINQKGEPVIPDGDGMTLVLGRLRH
ncbi:MAG: hypothetical protein WBH01_00615, partial [Dehalococcoidia bacterium]